MGDSWGKIIAATGSLATTLGADQPFRYRGYVYDEETGWYYLQSRYYDPETCRFISADVLLSTGQGVIGHNAFAYCGNNPIIRADESGCYYRPPRTWVETWTDDEINGGQRMPDKLYRNYLRKIESSNSNGTKRFSQADSQNAINTLFNKTGYGEKGVKIDFTGAGANIDKSYLVDSESVRIEVCLILEQTEGFDRTAGNLCAEWVFHNDVYRFISFYLFYEQFSPGIHFGFLLNNFKSSAESVDLDFCRDPRELVVSITSRYESLGLH